MRQNQKLRLLRAYYLCSRAMVAKAIFVSDRTYRNYENGIHRIPPDKLQLLAEFYGLPISCLMDDEDDFILIRQKDAQGRERYMPLKLDELAQRLDLPYTTTSELLIRLARLEEKIDELSKRTLPKPKKRPKPPKK